SRARRRADRPRRRRSRRSRLARWETCESHPGSESCDALSPASEWFPLLHRRRQRGVTVCSPYLLVSKLSRCELVDCEAWRTGRAMTIQRRHRDMDTATQILDVAERLAQSRGFNGFSYADIAAELRLTKAALHYHFAGKAELGEALIARYSPRFAAVLEVLDTSAISAPSRLEGYANLYLDVVRDKRMCLCGMLAAEYQTLPQQMREAVIQFFDANEAWLRGV